MKNLIGQFYLKRTAQGNLLGEFSNGIDEKIFTESADLVSANTSDYIGEYSSTWQEGKESYWAKLTISKKGPIYFIEWQIGSKVIFWGQGFLIDNILIGSYRNFENIS